MTIFLIVRTTRMENRATSSQHNGAVFGEPDFHLSPPDGKLGFFTERIWTEDGRVWQAVMICFASTAQDQTHASALDSVMDVMSPMRSSASWISFVLPEARALQEVGVTRSTAVAPKKIQDGLPENFLRRPVNNNAERRRHEVVGQHIANVTPFGRDDTHSSRQRKHRRRAERARSRRLDLSGRRSTCRLVPSTDRCPNRDYRDPSE